VSLLSIKVAAMQEESLSHAVMSLDIFNATAERSLEDAWAYGSRGANGSLTDAVLSVVVVSF
jgi:hypothetical protein